MKKHIIPIKKIYLLALLLMLSVLSSHAALLATGEIKGKVLDEKGEGLIGAAVNIIDMNGKNTGQGSAVDLDGNYVISSLMPGSYDIKISSIGYSSKLIKNVLVSADKSTFLNIQLAIQNSTLKDVVIATQPYRKPLIDRADTKIEQSSYQQDIRSTSPVYDNDGYSSSANIKNTGGLSIDNIASGAAGVTQTDAGRNQSPNRALSINGGRPDEVQYIVNGHRIISNPAPMAMKNKEMEYDMDMAPVHQDPPMQVVPIDKTTNESYKEITDNKFLSAAGAPLSTFSIDVDVASYGISRKKITDGILPPHDAVRIEELVNYFPYSYKDPADGRPFAVHTEFADCPWDASHRLLRIGIQGRHIAEAALPASNLVFLVDVSGSMYSPERLPLIQKSLCMLVDRMRPQDHLALVAYAGNAGLVLPSTSGANRDVIKQAINNLTAGGSTAGGAGIELAYKVATDNFIKGGNNRVMLCTDGDFNVGINGEAALTSFIEEKRKTGVFLSVLGVGTGNYKDREMEALADKGNGNYAYIDNEAEAKKNLVTQLGGTLNTIAKDVKIQAVFNPACVKSYRLIGYENRKLENRDFSNDKIDAGEIGAGTAVTALYEIVLGPERHESAVDLEGKGEDAQMILGANDLMALRIRYKAPDGNKSQLIESRVDVMSSPLASTSDDFRFTAAVASFGMLLRDSPYKGDATYDKAKALALGALGNDKEHYRKDFTTMIDQAHAIAGKIAQR